VPFVQGQLRNQKLSFTLHTECGHCQKPIQIEIDSELNYRLEVDQAAPLIYSPQVQIHELEPSIIDGF
jgi:hypothetical protein